MPPELARWASAEPDSAAAARWRCALDAAQRFMDLLLEREVPVLAGSDTPCGGILPGPEPLAGNCHCLWNRGCHPSALCVRRPRMRQISCSGQKLGRLRKGRSADLVFVRGDLTKHIPERPEIVLVMRDGAVYQPKELLQAAKAAASTMKSDPWARQFELHWAKKQEPVE